LLKQCLLEQEKLMLKEQQLFAQQQQIKLQRQMTGQSMFVGEDLADSTTPAVSRALHMAACGGTVPVWRGRWSRQLRHDSALPHCTMKYRSTASAHSKRKNMSASRPTNRPRPGMC
jgi:hypothetical protein